MTVAFPMPASGELERQNERHRLAQARLGVAPPVEKLRVVAPPAETEEAVSVAEATAGIRTDYPTLAEAIADAPTGRKAHAALGWLAADAGFSPAELLGRSRNYRVHEVRVEVWRVMADTLMLSTPQIGRIFGRDHSTIINGLKRAHKITPRQTASAECALATLDAALIRVDKEIAAVRAALLPVLALGQRHNVALRDQVVRQLRLCHDMNDREISRWTGIGRDAVLRARRRMGLASVESVFKAPKNAGGRE